VENEYCAKHQRVPAIKHESIPICNPIPSATVLGSWQSSIDPYDLSSDDDEYLITTNVAELTPGWSVRAVPLLPAASLNLDSPPQAPKNCWQIHPNLNDYDSHTEKNTSTFWLLDITNWWRQQEETNSKYTDLSNVAQNIFLIIPHGVGLEASFSLGQDLIGWRQSKTTGVTLCEKVVVTPFAQGNNGMLAGADPELDTKNTENKPEMKKEAKETTLDRMAKVHNFWRCGRAANPYKLPRRNL